MRHSSICGGEIRLEFFPDKGLVCATVSVDGDFEERPAAHCDAENLRAVLSGLRYHIAGKGWLCTLDREGESVRLDLWRDGLPPKRCDVPVQEYQRALDIAFSFSPAPRAYVA
jgi:hypothetical protein